MGDINTNVSESTLPSVMRSFKLKNLAKERPSYKTLKNYSCIFLFFVLFFSRSFVTTCVFETGLSDFLKLVLTLLR